MMISINKTTVDLEQVLNREINNNNINKDLGMNNNILNVNYEREIMAYNSLKENGVLGNIKFRVANMNCIHQSTNKEVQNECIEAELINGEIETYNSSLLPKNDKQDIIFQDLSTQNYLDGIKKNRAQSLSIELSKYISHEKCERVVNDILLNNKIDSVYIATPIDDTIQPNHIFNMLFKAKEPIEIKDPIEPETEIGTLQQHNFFDITYSTKARGGETYKILFSTVSIIISILDHLYRNNNGNINKKFLIESLVENIAISGLSKKEIGLVQEKLINCDILNHHNDFQAQIERYSWKIKNFSQAKISDEELYSLDLLEEYALVDNNGCVNFYQINDSKITRYTKSALKDKFANKTLQVLNPYTGRSKTMNPVDIVLASKHRKEFKKIAFDPSCTCDEETLNLFRGFKYEAKNLIDIFMFKTFVYEDLCDSNLLAFYVLWAYFAHLIQRPWEKTGICLIMTSPQGAGKGTLMSTIGELLNGYYMTSKDISHITGQFSKHLEKVLLFYGNEVSLKGNALHKFKNAVTELLTTSEGKGIDPYEAKNFTRFVVDGNDKPIDTSDNGRRWFELEIKGNRKGDQKFWNNLNNHINSDGFYESLMYDLSTFDYKKFEQYLYEAPKFHKNTTQIDPIVAWWSLCLENGIVPYVSYEVTHDDGLNITNELKYQSYKKWCQDSGFKCKYDIFTFGKEFTKKALCGHNELEKTGKITIEGKRVNSKVYSQLPKCREVFTTNYNINNLNYVSNEWQIA